MKKNLKILLIILIILISNFAILINTVNAVEYKQNSLYAIRSLDRMLKYNGILVKTTYVVYSENGNEYPAYCLNVDRPGAEVEGYDVTNQGQISDIELWRVIINGYPYKNLAQLGVENIDEAYTATKQSIYCYLYNRGVENYSGVGESGERVVNAMNQILTNAKNSNENFEEIDIEITQTEEWENDDIQIWKTYEINSQKNIKSYSIEIENGPEGYKITNLDNQEKSEFNSGEKFKISIPIENLKESGKFTIKIKTQMETKPVFFGQAPNENVQNYALTTFSYQEKDTELIQEYTKNDTKIIIKKQDEDGNMLNGAKFEILDENQELILTQETNEEGIIELNNFLPGKYYIKEIEAPEGYEMNEKLIEIEIKLNETKNVIINNSKIIIEEPPKEEPEVEKTEIVEEIKRLPKTGM